jgi:uncharacterized protein
VKSIRTFHGGLGFRVTGGAHFLEHVHEDPEGESRAEHDETEQKNANGRALGSLAFAALARVGHLHVEQLQELLWCGLIGFVLFVHGFHIGQMMMGSSSHEKAYLAPFFVFLAFLLVAELVSRVGDGYAHWMLAEPRYWIFPVQTGVCGWLLWRWRGHYAFGPNRGWLVAVGVGMAALAVWVAPQWLFGAAPRVEGFNPTYFGPDGAPYTANLSLRLLRMVIVVPLVEEIFWRGWLLRYLVNEDFQKVPFGTFTWKSFLITSVAFCFEHHFADWPAAVITGALYNFVAYRTKSLAACVVAHAVTNGVLAVYILRTGQWGFW